MLRRHRVSFLCFTTIFYSSYYYYYYLVPSVVKILMVKNKKTRGTLDRGG